VKSVFLRSTGNYEPEGTPVKINFEGKITRGTLVDSNSDKRIVLYKTADGENHWTHESRVTLDRPELAPTVCRRI
jgi:hypothetical protein